MLWVKRALAPPIFEDRDKTHTARMLNTMSLSALVLLILGSLDQIAAGGVERGIVLDGGASLTMCLVVLLNRRGHVQAAASIFLVIFWCFFLTGAYTSQGLLSPTFPALSVVIVSAGLLLGRRSLIFAVVMSILGGMFLAFAETHGLLPHHPAVYTAVTRLSSYGLTFVLTAVILEMTLQNSRESLQRAREELVHRIEVSAALQQNQLLLESIVNNTPAIIYVKYSDGQYGLVNVQWMKTFGIAQEHVAGKTDREVFSQEYAAMYRTNDLAVLESKVAITSEEEAPLPDGLHTYVSVKFPLLDPDGEVYATCSISTDITERKRAEEAVKVREQKYRMLFENMTAGFALHEMIYDAQGNPQDYRYLDVNPAFEKLTGVPTSALLGSTVRTVLPSTEQYWIEVFGKVAKTGEPIAYENYSRELGKYYDTWAYCPVKDQFAVVFTDITARKKVEEQLQEREERLRLALRAGGMATWQWTVATDKLLWSDNAGLLLGLDADLTEITLEAMRQIIHPEDQAVFDRLEDVLGDGRKEFSIEFRIHRMDGALCWLSSRGQVDYDGNGHVQQIRGVLLDVTDRKNAEQRQQETLTQVRYLTGYLQSVQEQERAHIAREIHDELGQALTAIKMDVRWLRRTLDLKGAAVNLEEVSQKLDAMNETVESTIRTVRQVATELRPAVLDTLGLVSALEWQAREFENRTGLPCDFTSNVEDVRLEPSSCTAVFRIFQETLTNITRHAHASRVEAKLFEDATGLRMQVQDDGVGMTPVDPGSFRSFGILGMRERALLLGGEVTVASEANQGTTVTLRIPSRGMEIQESTE